MNKSYMEVAGINKLNSTPCITILAKTFNINSNFLSFLDKVNFPQEQSMMLNAKT